jgi:transketolase
VSARFASYRWNVLHVSDANDLASIDSAIRSAQAEAGRPTLIVLDSHIAWGAPHKQDTASAHGEPLGEDEIRLTKQRYGWPEDAKFLVPEEALEHTRKAVARGDEAERQWQARLEDYLQAHPDLGREWRQIQRGELPEGWDSAIPSFPPDEKGIASRDAGSKVLNAIAPSVPWLIGGSADLAPSTKTLIKDGGDFEAGAYGARNFHFGIREHAMGAVLNGMALSGLRPYGATFLIFSDYMKASVRLSALMEQPSIFIFTHDSVGVGEDGPTHQPIEQLMALRAIPNLFTFRPADANEVAESWRCIMGLRDHPAALVLTRQALPTLDRSKYASAEGVSRGAYTLADGGGLPQVILMATGSEVQLCVRAYEQLKESGIRARVVSMPCWELFERQPRQYRDEILPPQVRARVAVEAGTSLGWSEYVGLDGRTIARRQFGASAPFAELLKQFGFTVDNVVAEARALVEGAS